MKTYNVSDAFIREFLSKYSEDQILLLKEGLKTNFAMRFEDKKLISADYTDSNAIFNSLCSHILVNLFDVRDNSGFPKAKEFVSVFMDGDIDRKTGIVDGISTFNISDIAYKYIINFTRG